MYFCVGIGLVGTPMCRFEADGNLHKRPCPDCPPISSSWRFNANSSYPHASGQHEHAPRFAPSVRQDLKRDLAPRRLSLDTMITTRLAATAAAKTVAARGSDQGRGYSCSMPSAGEQSGSYASRGGSGEGGGAAGSLPIRWPKAIYTGIYRSLYDRTPPAELFRLSRLQNGMQHRQDAQAQCQKRLARAPFHVSGEEPAFWSSTAAEWLRLWFRCMVLSAVAEKVRLIGPKLGREPLRVFSSALLRDRHN
ncbi:hypothetical protein B0I37DRAFT_62353 [Chaetomium sp. MPI-CAGE-AT-0009]|nr:hypothetical protein B0I37DRAFT_62353 [Chaetomium sp. MPI-CAGE-AT-0009]